MENIASPLDLLTSLKIAFVERDEAADAFDVFKQDAIMAHEPSPADAPAISSDDAADAADLRHTRQLEANTCHVPSPHPVSVQSMKSDGVKVK